MSNTVKVYVSWVQMCNALEGKEFMGKTNNDTDYGTVYYEMIVDFKHVVEAVYNKDPLFEHLKIQIPKELPDE